MSAPYIICVDDDRTILMSLKAQLRFCLGDRYHIEVAESAAEAEELIEELFDDGENVAVVISDWLMPEVKGDEFLIALHQQHPQIVKIMLTGHADEEAILRAQQEAGLDACFTKPWVKEELVSKILALCAQRT